MNTYGRVAPGNYAGFRDGDNWSSMNKRAGLDLIHRMQFTQQFLERVPRPHMPTHAHTYFQNKESVWQQNERQLLQPR
jgi:hypothetical protein